jgi:hypothetical protein
MVPTLFSCTCQSIQLSVRGVVCVEHVTVLNGTQRVPRVGHDGFQLELIIGDCSLVTEMRSRQSFCAVLNSTVPTAAARSVC